MYQLRCSISSALRETDVVVNEEVIVSTDDFKELASSYTHIAVLRYELPPQ